jgi:hypothetical protein
MVLHGCVKQCEKLNECCDKWEHEKLSHGWECDIIRMGTWCHIQKLWCHKDGNMLYFKFGL